VEPSREPAPDPVGLVLGSLGFGTSLGLAVQALVTWTVRALQGGTPVVPPSLSSGPALVLLLGTLGGIAAAGGATWIMLNPIRNPWRQAMLAMIAGLGSFVVSLVTIPIDRRFGRTGLLFLAVLAGIACFRIGRRLAARRAAW
jgi:hypothetical protein